MSLMQPLAINTADAEPLSERLEIEIEARKLLLDILSYKRPAKSHTEQVFCQTFLSHLDGIVTDAYGNYILAIPQDTGKPSRVMWSCHTDTVHRTAGRQALSVDNGMVSIASSKDSSCLGADCGAGVWLMLEMIAWNVPGLYVFHRAEEIGGLGSSYIANKTPELLAELDFAIAFDRRGYGSVITHQAGGRCCSDTFAAQLALQLPFGYEADPCGVFTDTANYTDLVPECTNLSVGYDHEHSTGETLDLDSIERLRDALIDFEEADLVAVRDPTIVDDCCRWADHYSPDNDERQWPRSVSARGSLLEDWAHDDFKTFIRQNAAGIADWFERNGMDEQDLRDQLDDKLMLKGF